MLEKSDCSLTGYEINFGCIIWSCWWREGMKLVVALVVSKLYYTITIIFYIILMILTGALGQTDRKSVV